MAINKVVYNSNTIIDLTTDTVSADVLLYGQTAHDKSGNKITGTIQETFVEDETLKQRVILTASSSTLSAQNATVSGQTLKL